MATFFGLEISEDLEKQILKETITKYFVIKSLDSCVKYTEILFDIFMDHEDELINNFQTWKTILMKHTKYNVNIFYNQVYITLHPLIYDKTIVAFYQNMLTPSLELAKEEAKEAMKSFDAHLKLLFENQEIWADIDSNYSLKQKRFALKETILLLRELLDDDCSVIIRTYIENLQDIYDSDDINKKKLNKNNMPPKEIKQSRKSKKFFSLLEKTNLNYLSADKTIFYIHIVNIAYAISSLMNTLNNYERIVNHLKHILELPNSKLDQFDISNLLKKLCAFRLQIDSNQLLQYIAEIYYIFWFKELNDFEDFKDFFAILFGSKGSKKLFINRLNMELIDPPYSFFLYPSISVKDDPTHLDDKIHQLCKTSSIVRDFESLKDISTIPEISNKIHHTGLIGRCRYINSNFDRI